jgi:hypothetical protein
LLKAILEWIKSVWEIFNSPKNDTIIIGLLIALAGIIVSNITMYFSFRARLKDKDKMIVDLVDQRNKLQDYILKGKNINRKTSKK